MLNPDQENFIKIQLELIEKILFFLDQLLTSTYENHSLGRGFGSHYPEKSIMQMKTFKYALELEIQSHNQYLENKKSEKIREDLTRESQDLDMGY